MSPEIVKTMLATRDGVAKMIESEAGATFEYSLPSA